MRRFVSSVVVLGSLALAGCAGKVVVEPAPHAEAPECADVMLRLPEKIGEHANRKTSAQATDAWGDPSVVVLRCGMDSPAPTTDPCVRVEGVDWVSRSKDEHTWRFITYGRTPAVEVLIDERKMAGATALQEISPAVSTLPKSGECVGAQDVQDPSATKAPQAPATGTPAATPRESGTSVNGAPQETGTSAPGN